MKNWEKNIRKVVPYTPGEQPKKSQIIKLNTNENPYPPAPGVKEALAHFHTDDLRLYPDPVVTDLVDGIAQFYQVDPSQVFVGVGSDDVLAMLFMTFFNSKKPILFPDITYSFYDVWAEMLRIPYTQIPLDDAFRRIRQIINGKMVESYSQTRMHRPGNFFRYLPLRRSFRQIRM